MNSRLNRRHFLGGALAVSPSVIASAGAGPRAVREEGKRRRFLLWCDKGGLINPAGPADDPKVAEFVRKCSNHGVTDLIPWSGTRVLVEEGRKKGIQVHPYLAFNSHGSRRVNYAWSIHYLSAAPGSPEMKAKLERHQPIWSHPRSSPSLSDFAQAHPQYWARDRSRSDEIQPGQRRTLSLAVPEVREHQKGNYMALLKRTGGHGFQVEFVSLNQDENGVGTDGYEAPMTRFYRKKFRRDPMELPNDDPSWVRFRADYTTVTIRELREALREEDPSAPMTVALVAREMDEYVKVFQDWPTWVDQNLVDELHLWFRTTSDVRRVERQVSAAVKRVAGRCPVVAEFSCYHVGSFQDPDLLMEAARRAYGSGADAAGIYRSHAVEQLGFWPLVEKIAAL